MVQARNQPSIKYASINDHTMTGQHDSSPLFGTQPQLMMDQSVGPFQAQQQQQLHSIRRVTVNNISHQQPVISQHQHLHHNMHNYNSSPISSFNGFAPKQTSLATMPPVTNQIVTHPDQMQQPPLKSMNSMLNMLDQYPAVASRQDSFNNNGLTQLRPRVNSISVTKREPTPTAVCSPKLPPVLTRSLSFSGGPGNLVQVDRPRASVSGRGGVGDGDSELCCLGSEPIPGCNNDHLVGNGGAHYYDIYGTPMHLASGSISSACSSIGSPVPVALPTGNCGDPGLVGYGSPSLSHHPRPISSNSSSDGAAIYGQQQQQHLHSNNNNNNNVNMYNNIHQIQQQHQASTTTASSCGSSIISTSDSSLSMSINLEQYISKRNERERSRVRNVNDAFDNLKNCLPLDVEKMSKRMSKVEILRTAIGYIRNLEQILGYEQQLGGGAGNDGMKSHQPSLAAAKRMSLSRDFRRLDSHRYHQRHHTNRKNLRSNEERAQYDLDGLTQSDYSPDKMIKQDEDNDHVGSVASSGYSEGKMMIEYERQHLVEDRADKEQAESGGDDVDGSESYWHKPKICANQTCSFLNCMDDRFEDY